MWSIRIWSDADGRLLWQCNQPTFICWALAGAIGYFWSRAMAYELTRGTDPRVLWIIVGLAILWLLRQPLQRKMVIVSVGLLSYQYSFLGIRRTKVSRLGPDEVDIKWSGTLRSTANVYRIRIGGTRPMTLPQERLQSDMVAIKRLICHALQRPVHGAGSSCR